LVRWRTTAAADQDGEAVPAVAVEPIVDSLASARISAVCEIGFRFNATTLLCGQLGLYHVSHIIIIIISL